METSAAPASVFTPILTHALAESRLPSEVGNELGWAYQPHFAALTTLQEEMHGVVALSPTDARKFRLALKAIRVASDKTRESLKADILVKGRIIDRINTVLVEHLVPVEKTMREIEEAEAKREVARLEAVKAERTAKLKPYTDPSLYNLGAIAEGDFERLLADVVAAHEARQVAAAKAEAERIAREQAAAAERARRDAEREAEIVRLREENRQRAIQAEAERVERLQQEAVQAAERKRLADIALAEKREADAIAAKAQEQARADRVAREAAEDALEQQRKALADKAERERLAARKAARAPEKTRLEAYATAIRALPIPTITDPVLSAKIAEQQSKFAAWIELEAGKL
jgi:hypothetical protein